MAKSKVINKLVRQLVEAEEKYGGADRLHSYRDAITDVLHVYFKDESVPDVEKRNVMDMLQSSPQKRLKGEKI